VALDLNDAAKGIKGLDAIVSAFRAGDRARDGSRAADGARAPEPPPARPRPGCPRSSFTARTPVLMAATRRRSPTSRSASASSPPTRPPARAVRGRSSA